MRRKQLIVIGILLLLFFGIFFLMQTGSNNFLDRSIYQFVISFRCDLLDQYFIYITRFANTATILVIVAAFILIFRNRYGIFLGVAACSSVLSNLVIKNIIQRARPDHLRLISQGGFSFPSGHSMIAVCVYGYLCYLVYQKISNPYLKYGLLMLLATLILSIGLSRIYVGVHYPTDVMAGFLLATVEVILIVEISHKIYSRGESNV